MKLAAFIFGAIPLLVQHYARKYMEDDKATTLVELEKDFGLPRIKTYDFIVIGGGTAGCVIAGRLSERFSVLLLEAGGTPVPMSNVPYFTRAVASDPDTNYLYKSVPQVNMSLAYGGIVGLETGKMLGGSGSHNDMGHQRGSPQDWDSYAEISQDPSWRYDNVVRLFKKSETFVGTLLNPEQSDYYGTDGPLSVGSHIPPIFSKWAEAGLELGYPTADPNALQIRSFAPFHTLIDDGRRVSSYNKYILPHEGNRGNLTVVRYATVRQILFDEDNKAYGVSYSRHGIPQVAHARNEIVLSAGAINSPLILMMSGIGPRSTLEAAGIEVKLEKPSVGENFSDHVWLYIGGFTFNASADPYLPRIPENQLESAITEYLETGRGEFGVLQEGPQAFYVSSRAVQDGESNWPDGRIAIDAACPMSLEDDVETQLCFFMDLGRPKSRGKVSLNVSEFLEGSLDFVRLAEIDFRGLTVPSDMDVMIEGVELIMKVIEETTAFKSMGASYTGSPLPACSAFPFRSREYWTCYIHQMSNTAIHMVGTCAMGADPGAVVDSKLRVRGVTGLRVADASVLPAVPNANLNGPVILVGEKAAEDILSDWSR